MNNKRMSVVVAVTLGGVATSLAAGSGISAAAPSGPSNAADTIARLQAEGNQVIVNKVGSGPTENCTVTSVRPVQTQMPPSGNPLTGVPNMQTVTTVHVGLEC